MSDLLEQYESELAAIEEIYQRLPPTHTHRLTIPEIFGRSYDENFISDYLAYILNPEANGIGVEPLNAVLSLVSDLAIEKDSRVTIHREFTFKGGGRIDFIILIDKEIVIGIENKITAFEGEQQTLSYEDSIAHDFPNMRPCLVFLTPQGTKASSSRFVPLTYADLLHALRALPFSPLPDIHKCVIWEDFLTHLEEYIIMGNRSLDLQELTLLYLKHQKLLDDLSKSVEADGKHRQSYALSKLKDLFFRLGLIRVAWWLIALVRQG